MMAKVGTCLEQVHQDTNEDAGMTRHRWASMDAHGQLLLCPEALLELIDRYEDRDLSARVGRPPRVEFLAEGGRDVPGNLVL